MNVCINGNGGAPSVVGCVKKTYARVIHNSLWRPLIKLRSKSTKSLNSKINSPESDGHTSGETGKTQHHVVCVTGCRGHQLTVPF